MRDEYKLSFSKIADLLNEGEIDPPTKYRNKKKCQWKHQTIINIYERDETKLRIKGRQNNK